MNFNGKTGQNPRIGQREENRLELGAYKNALLRRSAERKNTVPEIELLPFLFVSALQIYFGPLCIILTAFSARALTKMLKANHQRKTNESLSQMLPRLPTIKLVPKTTFTVNVVLIEIPCRCHECSLIR